MSNRPVWSDMSGDEVQSALRGVAVTPLSGPSCVRGRSRVRGRRARVRLLWAAACAAVCAASPAAAQESARGRLHIVWDTGDRTGSAAEHYLVEADGRSRLLVLDMTRAAVEQLSLLDRREVELREYSVTDGRTGIPALRVGDLRAVAAAGELTGAGPTTAAGAGDRRSLDFVTVLCRFPDGPAPAFTRADVETAHGGSYPGLRHFYAELSWNPGMMAGSRVTDWYTLPQPRAAYVSDTYTDFGRLAADCTRAAERDVHFPDFFGINLQFSGGLSRRASAPYDTLSFGGSWSFTLNGESRSWGVTWLSGSHASNYVVLAHEVGHALGWPHSSGSYGGDYDSDWDVMSRGYLRWEPPYGWLGVHTISHHKDVLGWVPSERRWEPSWGAIESGLLARTALPPREGYLFARIPTAGGSFYTAESRQLAGHDRPLPGEAVVLHRVSNQRAYVVDVDDNGNPNDEGAQWHPGEEFQDSVRGFSLRVDSASAAGFHVSITRGWRMDVSAAGPGGVVVSAAGRRVPCDSVCSPVAGERGTVMLLEPMPAEGGVFSHWEGACGPTRTCTVKLDGNRRVRAVFTPSFVVVTDSLKAAVMGAAYRNSVVPGAAASAPWSVVQGSLPPGLTLGESGIIEGIATSAGTFAFVVAGRSGASEVRRALSLNVVEPVLAVDHVVDQLLSGSGLSEDEARFLDLLGNRNGRLDVGDVVRWLEAGSMSAAEKTRVRSLLRTGEGS